MQGGQNQALCSGVVTGQEAKGHRVTQKGWGVSILGDIQALTEGVSGQSGLGDPALSRGVGLDNIQSSLPTSTIL